MSRYSRRNVTKRLEEEIRHKQRALEENSRFVTKTEFINDIEVFILSGDINNPRKEFGVYFKLNNPIVAYVFKQFLEDKLKGAIVE